MSRRQRNAKPEARYLVIGLTDEGEELRRVTVHASKLQEAKDLFQGFSDWIDIYRCEADGSVTRCPGWSRG